MNLTSLRQLSLRARQRAALAGRAPRSSSPARRRWCSAALLEQPGEPVSKQELFATVWRGTVVSDDALVTCIQELRKALGDDAKQPLYIETRHRQGYRFAAPVS